MKHKGLGSLILIVGLVGIACFGASAYMVAYALLPADNPGRDYTKEYQVLFANYPETKPWIDSLQRT